MNTKVSPHVIRSGMNEGVKAIQREIDEHGTDEDKECLHYVLHEKAWHRYTFASQQPP